VTISDERIFGTDGIRGRAGEGWLAGGRVLLLGRTVGAVLAERGGAELPLRALTGHDGRRSGPELEALITAGLSASGYEVKSCGLITTPGLALLTRTGEHGLGVMISASHNPAADNGIKLFQRTGEKLADELEEAIEDHLRASDEPEAIDPVSPPHDPELEETYLEHLLASAGELKLDGMTIVLDCANGGGSRIAPRVLGRLGAHVISIGAEPDGSNINEDCGSTSPERMQETVRLHGAHFGVALDGDGDRCILCDEQGRLVDGDGILTVLGRHLAASGKLADPRVVATVMSNRGLHRALREVGVSVVTVGAGDRRVTEALRNEGLPLGGEQSGHILFGDEGQLIGDGISTALHVLAVMRETGEPLSKLAEPFQAFPQVLLNIPVGRKPDLGELPRLAAAVRAAEEELGEDGRVLLRYSGTEPLARVMVEGPDGDWIRERAGELAALITNEIGA
jgi:phosphoglucosamine mutase